SESVATAPEKRPRLKFIDMSRSLAILLMLEGHFTGAALANEYRKDDYLLYKIWHNIHGLTSPLFFTVTGVIFVYLLSVNNTLTYFHNSRVKKGFKRVLELLFWGYFIQLSLWSIIQSFYYGSKFHLEWFYAFHVLQSIGVGIFFLLVIYGIFKWINKGALHWYYLVSGLLLFVGYSSMKNYIQLDEQAIAEGLQKGPKYFPNNAPAIIQNMFYGKFSDFSFLRYSGYTILGGMLGSIIRTYENKTKEWWFGTTFLVTGIIISIFIQPIFRNIDNFTEWIGITEKGFYELNATAFIRYGQVVSVLGVFMLIDKYVDVKAKLYLKLGQNTLPIYVVHVIILYGGIFGIGLKPIVFDENLGPWIAAGISAIAILFFTLMVYYIEILEDKYETFIRLITFKKKK
ncbi:MAG: acyltransferase family protein, partial [Flavobacteriia bacterium]